VDCEKTLNATGQGKGERCHQTAILFQTDMLYAPTPTRSPNQRSSCHTRYFVTQTLYLGWACQTPDSGFRGDRRDPAAGTKYEPFV
jgi:hypothetical protein